MSEDGVLAQYLFLNYKGCKKKGVGVNLPLIFKNSRGVSSPGTDNGNFKKMTFQGHCL